MASRAVGYEVIPHLGSNPATVYPFSQKVLQLLLDAGWSSARSVDLTEYEEMLTAQGIEMFPCVREFLRQFGSLEFTKRIPVTGVLGANLPPGVWENVVWFGTAPHTTGTNPWEEDSVSSLQLEIELQHVGFHAEAGGWWERFRLLMDASGKMYGYDGGLYGVGFSGEDGIEAVLTNRPPYSVAGIQDHFPAWWWQDYVTRTGIVPPDDVVAMLRPEAREAILEAG